jgi:LysM repeat protein
MRIVVRLVVLTAVLALSVVAVAPAAAAPSALPPQPGTILGQHTVVAGDTLDCIGRAYKVDPNAIAQVNGTSSPAAGQKLNIPAVAWYNIPTGTTCTAQFTVPAGWPPPPPTTIFGQHTVKQGEWIYCIARAYKVNPMAIAQASGIPGPYGPAWGWYGQGWHGSPYGGTCPGCGGCAGTYGGCGGYYPYFSPWNLVWPSQVLQIPAVPWYNIPAGTTCAAQSTVVLPGGW